MICDISGVIRRQDGRLAASVPVCFEKRSKHITKSSIGPVLSDTVYASTNSLGVLSVSVVSGDYYLNIGPIRQAITVPDIPAASLDFILSGASLPTITTTGAVVTTFQSGGVTYYKAVFNASGSFKVNAYVVGAHLGLVAGGASGGKTSGPGTRAGGGGAGQAVDAGIVALTVGEYTVTVGAGAPPNAGGNTQGTNGSNSSISGPISASAVGGGYGGGNTGGFNDGGAGGNGGGGTGSGVAPTVGGIGVQNNGGAGFFSADTDKSAGGGGGAGGPGLDGVFNIGGNGGPGVIWAWADNLSVAGGGGGVGVTNGTASHGGTPGGSATNATNGGGSGGRQGGSTGAGGNGLGVLVVPATSAVIVSA